MQITSFLHCIIHHLWPTFVPHFSTLSHKGTVFAKRLLNVKCMFRFSLQILSETFLILGRIQRDIIINIRKSSCKVPVILIRHQTSRKSIQWEQSCSMRTDKDRHKEGNSHFWKFFKCT